MTETKKELTAEAVSTAEAAKTKKQPAKTKNKNPKFSIEALKSNCFELFGISSSLFEGAVYGKSGSYTVDEMRNIIEIWKNKEAK